MDRKQATELYLKYISGKCTPEEKKIVEQAFERDFHVEEAGIESDEVLSRLQANGRDRLEKATSKKRIRIIPLAMKITAAASLLLVGIYYFNLTLKTNDVSTSTVVKTLQDVPPGRNIATLTLSNGQQIVLDEKIGQVAKQGATVINTQSGGLLAYSSTAGGNDKGAINMITVPKGGQFQITLSDGSKIWLNSSSTLRYPVSFGKNGMRTVTLDGEGYFEIAHDANRPFVVQSKTQQVQVLGTHFNINAYPDEPAVKTTLLEGSVLVKSQKRSLLLTPGELATNENGNLVESVADPDLATAWKNGSLEFRNADFSSIMRMVSRWYNLEVEYDGPIPQRKFVGKISKQSNLSSMLKILKLARINFSIIEREGKTVLIVKS